MHIDEELLEQYLVNPHRLSSKQQQEVKQHLETCDSCQSVYAYLKSYYEELAATELPKLPLHDLFSNDHNTNDDG